MLSCGNWCEPASIERKVGLHFFFLFRIYQKGKVIKRRASHVEQCVPPCNELSNFGFLPSKKSLKFVMTKCKGSINTMAYTLMLGGVGFGEKVRLEIQMADIYYHLWPTLGYYRRKQEESKTFFLINLFTSGESWCNYKCPNAVISFVYSFSSLFCHGISRVVLKILTIQLLALSHRS
jgi:hypothetical protein